MMLPLSLFRKTQPPCLLIDTRSKHFRQEPFSPAVGQSPGVDWFRLFLGSDQGPQFGIITYQTGIQAKNIAFQGDVFVQFS